MVPFNPSQEICMTYIPPSKESKTKQKKLENLDGIFENLDGYESHANVNERLIKLIIFQVVLIEHSSNKGN